MIPHVRILLACLFLVLAATFLFGLIHSYWGYTYAVASYDSDRMSIAFRSEASRFDWLWSERKPFESAWRWRTTPIEEQLQRRKILASLSGPSVWPPEPSLFCFSFFSHDGRWMCSMPYWFPVVLCGSVGFAFKPRPRFKFGIRDLLVLLTVSAIALTVVTQWMRLGAPVSR
jgi:hypothetical protein